MSTEEKKQDIKAEDISVQKKNFVEDIKNFVGPTRFALDCTLYGPIKWEIWATRFYEEGYSSKKVEDLLVFFSDRHIARHYGSYELQIIVDKIVQMGTAWYGEDEAMKIINNVKSKMDPRMWRIIRRHVRAKSPLISWHDCDDKFVGNLLFHSFYESAKHVHLHRSYFKSKKSVKRKRLSSKNDKVDVDNNINIEIAKQDATN